MTRLAKLLYHSVWCCLPVSRVRVFNPFAPSNRNLPIATCYRSHENQKKRAYEQRVREVEHGTFTPLVMSASGGLARQAITFYKRLADLLAIKHNQPYSKTMNWLRCRLTFSLLRSAIQCIRGSRSSWGKPIYTPQIDLVCSEAQVWLFLNNTCSFSKHFIFKSLHAHLFLVCTVAFFLEKKKERKKNFGS